MAIVSPDYPEGRTFLAAERVYNASLEWAFAIAVRDRTLGQVVARRARAGLLTHLLIPYDALLGRHKDDQHDLSPLTNAVRADFQQWLIDSLGISNDARLAAMNIHGAWMATITAVHERLIKQWDDSRRVWLPMQLALTPEEHDDQVEIDALIARVIGRPFSRGNQVTYLNEDRVQLEIARSIVAARDYHVLWVHDYAGTRSSGSVDAIGYAQTANVYFPALTQAVARFDSTGELTTYMLFLDQNFYEPANGRLWMTILEDPLGAEIELPGKNDSLEACSGASQDPQAAAVRDRPRRAVSAHRRSGEAACEPLASRARGNSRARDRQKQPPHHRRGPAAPRQPDARPSEDRVLRRHRIRAVPRRDGAVGVGVGEHYATPTGKASRCASPPRLRAGSRGTRRRTAPAQAQFVLRRRGSAAASRNASVRHL
jgi:hypothetical protein